MPEKNENKLRCPWCLSFEDYVRYHDEEWGVPVHDDRKHFEFLILEGAQAGLSWATVLKKRANYRKAFADFNVKKVSQFTEDKIEELLLDPGIIRNRLKVNAAVSNARKFIEVQKEWRSFNNYIWSFTGGKTIVNAPNSMTDILPTSKESDALSKDLMKRGFKFVGSTVMYSHMQACGLVNDHLIDCWRYKDICKLAFKHF